MTPPKELTLRPIGHVRTAYADPAETPIQTRRNPDEHGRPVVLDQYADALDGLEVAGLDPPGGPPIPPPGEPTR
jgi:tRNA (Thr-GGU) A37 N-methylase